MTDLLTELRQPSDAPVWHNPFRAHELAQRAADQIERLTRERADTGDDITSRVRRLLHDKDCAIREVMRERDKALAQVAALREALEKIANHRPSFDYCGSDEFGPRVDIPGSPYDRGKEDANNLLAGVARGALTDTAAAAEAYTAKVRREALEEAIEWVSEANSCRTCGEVFLRREGHEGCDYPNWDSVDPSAAIRAAMEDEK